MFRRIPMPFYSPDGDGGAGGAGGDNNPASNLGGGPGPAGGGTGSVVDLTPDHMVRIAGQKDPIKFSDYRRDYISQAEYTKKTQAHAAQVKAWEAEKAQATQQLLDYAKKLAAGKQQQGPREDPLADLRKQSVIDGNAAASIVETIQNQGIGPIVKAIEKRDQAMKIMYDKMTQMARIIDKLESGNANGALKTKIAQVRDSMGLPDDPEVNEYFQDIYGSHEGENWDDEFPEVAKRRFEAIKKAVRDTDRKAASVARNKLIPGKGSDVSFKSKVKTGYKSPSDWADELGNALGIPD